MPGFPERYRYVIEEELIWRDMDAFQHVNNAVYFRYFEDVRMRCFEAFGVVALMNESKLGPILASTRCDFRAPLTYPGRIRVGTSIAEIRPKRFTMVYGVWSEEQDVLAAEGEGLLVYYDYGRSRSCEIPEAIRARLETLIV